MSGGPGLLIAMPHCGPVHAAAARSFFARATAPGGPFGAVYNVEAANSIAPAGFNDALLAGLRLRDEGAVRYFAMIHSDVEAATPAWADALHREMAARGDVLCSAVVPIKDDSGESSTAVGVEHDPWQVARRVRMDERGRLPETFGLADLPDARLPGAVLLVNTGLWLADLADPFWDGFGGFNVITRIGIDPMGRRVSQARPEDWEMSRALHAAGRPYSATFAVEARHHGGRAWGTPPRAAGGEA